MDQSNFTSIGRTLVLVTLVIRQRSPPALRTPSFPFPLGMKTDFRLLLSLPYSFCSCSCPLPALPVPRHRRCGLASWFSPQPLGTLPEYLTTLCRAQPNNYGFWDGWEDIPKDIGRNLCFVSYK